MPPANLSLTFRVGDPQTADYDRFAGLINAVVGGQHFNSKRLRDWDASLIAEDIFVRYAACLGEQIIGYGTIGKEAIDTTSCFSLWLTIDATYRGQGFGSQLYDFLEAQVAERGATELTGECMDNDPGSLAFARQRGFGIRRHAFASELDLTTFRAEPLLTIVEKAKAGGIRFTSLAAEGDTETAQRKLFELNEATAQDNPGNRDVYEDTFENFQAKILGASWFRADGQLLAVDGEQYVGLGAVGFEADGVTAFNAFTGVRRAYRGRGIAQALKILAAQYAIDKGARVIVTDNDSENGPMLAVNDKLGYIRQPGTYWLEKTMR